MDCKNLPVAAIYVPPNRRKATEKRVTLLLGSIVEIGLQHPIGVLADGDRFRLIHGRHRLAAYERLHRTEIPAVVHDLDETHAEIATIDENLLHTALTKLEEAAALKRRKQLYLAIHPETKAGGDRGNQHTGGKATDCRSATFTEDTSSKTGQSRRTVERSVAIAEAIPEDVQAAIADSPVADNQSELKKLAAMPEEQQREVAAKLAAGAGSVQEAVTGKKKVKRKKATKKTAPKADAPPAATSEPKTTNEFLDDQEAAWRAFSKESKFSLPIVLNAIVGRCRKLGWKE
jgi:ParB family chromosome partitioning protein